MTLVNREPEARELRALADEKGSHLALLYGRRRIGKTFLLTHLWDRERAFYFTASATTPEQNRRQLIREATEWSGREIRAEDHPTWRSVFRMLLELAPRPSPVIVLDEFQYLGEDPADLAIVASELNAAWETPREDRSLLLVLSGSAVRTLEALDTGSAPLYGRLSWKAELGPFDYRDAGEMAAFPDLRDRAYAYGIYGGTPRFLAPVDPERPLADNVSRQVLSPRGEVRLQMETAILQEEGLREIPKYMAILNAIGAGRTELNQVADLAGLDLDTALRSKVDRLVELGYVEKRRNLGAGKTAPYRYRLGDPALMFHHHFVRRFETALEVEDPGEVWRLRIAGDELDTYMGPVFEVIAKQAYQRLRGARDLPAVAEWGRWEGLARDGDPVEVDLACRLLDGRMLTGLVKWNRTPLGSQWHRHHLRSLERLAESGLGWAHAALDDEALLVYVAAGGFEEEFVEVVGGCGARVVLWSLQDLY